MKFLAKTIAAVDLIALLAIGAAPAHASNGSFVTAIQSAGPNLPNCVYFVMKDDGPQTAPAANFFQAGTVTYGYSLQSPSAALVFAAVKMSHDSYIASGGATGLPVFFTTTTSDPHQADCAGSPALFVTKVSH